MAKFTLKVNLFEIPIGCWMFNQTDSVKQHTNYIALVACIVLICNIEIVWIVMKRAQKEKSG